MTLTNLKSRIIVPTSDEQSKELRLEVDNLADRIFSTNHNFFENNIDDSFLCSTPYEQVPPFWKEKFPRDVFYIGPFERTVLSKLHHPQYPVLGIYGDLGCGKTTTKNFLIYTLEKLLHCKNPFCRKHKLIADIDFSQHTELNDFEGESLFTKVSDIICNELSSIIYDSRVLDPKKEYIDFWNFQHELKIHHNLQSISFNKIFEKPQFLNFQITEDDQSEIEKRARIFSQITDNKALLLDYFIHLWKFAKMKYFDNQNLCSVVFIDNIDQLFPRVQKKLFEIIINLSQNGGPTIVFFMRPETRHGNRKAVKAFDLLQHQGIEPIEVIRYRLEKFFLNPDSFFLEDESLSPQNFQLIKRYLFEIQKQINENPNNKYLNFLKNLSGKSIRIALILAQYLLTVKKSEMEKENISVNDVIRATIKEGKDFLDWDSDSQIEHLFKVSSGEFSEIFVKARILLVLSKTPNQWRRVGDIVVKLKNFGYSKSLIIEGINDLIKIKRHLVIADDKDVFNIADEASTHLDDRIKITDIGINYCQSIISDIQYLTEVMLDVEIDERDIPRKLPYNYLNERLHVLYIFLSRLLEIDIKETTEFIKNTNGTQSYFDLFGTTLLTTSIIQDVLPSAIGLLINQASFLSKENIAQYKEVCLEFKSLTVQAEFKNNDVLFVYPPEEAVTFDIITDIENLGK